MDNSDVLADNEAYNENKKDMEDDIISENFFNTLKGKRNYRARCLTNFSTSDKSSESLSGRRLAVKINPLDTIDSILPNPCNKEFDSSLIDILVSLFPTAWSSAPYENRYMLPNFGSVVRIKYKQRGPAELGKHRGLQYEFVSGDAKNYICENDTVVGKMSSKFGTGKKLLGKKNEPPPPSGDVGKPGAYGPPLKDKAWSLTSATGLKGNEHYSDATIKKDYFASTRKDRNTYDALIVKYSKIYNIDPNLVKAIIWKESGFKLKAQSSVGASGLTQVMPDTARGINKVLKYKSINLSDPDQAVHFGVYYIAKRINSVAKARKGGSIVERNSKIANVNTGGTGYSALELGLMSYNTGEGNLRKYKAKTVMSKTWACKNGTCGQTRYYVMKITAWHIWLTKNDPL